MLVAAPVGSVEVQDLPIILADGTVAPNLRLPPLSVVVFERFGKRGNAARFQLPVPAVSGSDPVVWGEGPVALDLKVPAAKDLTGVATLKLDLPDGAVKAQATASVGKEVEQTAFWHKDAAEIDAQVSGPLGTALTITGENTLLLNYRAPESVGAADQAAHIVRTDNQSGHVRLSLPLHPLQVTVGGETSSDHTQQGVPGNAASFTQSAVRTASQTAYVDVEWHPVAGLTLKGGTQARMADISWQDAHASSYRSVNPNLTATVAPLRDTTVTAVIEHTVAPYDAAAFAGYAAADKAAIASGFEPDHAWQLQTRVEQHMGPVRLTATYTAVRQGTVTEFADIGGVQAPATTPLLTRDSVAVAVTLPLSGVGMPRTDLSSQATWQSSRVVDPVTLQARTASGEPAGKVSLKLVHNLPAENLSIGFTSEYADERTTYQVRELSTTKAGGSLGAFVTYKPGNYELDFNVGGIYGSSTRDDFFYGRRGSSRFSHSFVQDNAGPTLNLSLKKPF